jgi:hypothetical protein
MKTQDYFKLFIGIIPVIFGFNSVVMAQFAAGEGGALPTFPTFTAPANTFPGFVIRSSGRSNNVFTPGTYAVLDMECINSESLETDSLILQSDAGGSWQDTRVRVTPSWSSISYEPLQSCNYRLRAKGGKLDGYTSNVQHGLYCSVNSHYSNTHMDESMFITGIMVPWIGRGISTSFEFKNIIDQSVLPNTALSYQWYRINPLSFEGTAIVGATTTDYVTTIDDAGYKLAIVATGDQITIGGFYQFISSWNNSVPNKGFITNATVTGFTLNLFKTVTELKKEELILNGDNGQVEITAVRKGDNDAIYHIDVPLANNVSYYLSNNNAFWKICEEMVFGEPGSQHSHLMEAISFSLLQTNETEVTDSGLRLHVDSESRSIWYAANQQIHSITVFDTSGKRIMVQNNSGKNGNLSVANLADGIYIVKMLTENGSITRKIKL